MPHLVLETTADLPENADVPDILEALVERLASFPTVDPKTIRSHHSLKSVWYVGEGSPAGFAHLTVKVRAGRATDWRQSIGEAMMEVLRETFRASRENGEVALSVEVREMDRETYIRE
jgi:5-carboxymethyl-2-hydroxymuconate isomerase